jgi:beta-glucosidase
LSTNQNPSSGYRVYKTADCRADGLSISPLGGLTTAPIPNAPQNDIGWQIYPIGLADMLKHTHKLVGDIPFEVLENGGAFNEAPDASGRIKDQRRIDFLDTHLRAVADAIAAGVPVRAYHQWSLMDNFEWSEGYSQRFGMVYTDHAKGQKRMPKDSAAWYAKVTKRNGLTP